MLKLISDCLKDSGKGGNGDASRTLCNAAARSRIFDEDLDSIIFTNFKCPLEARTKLIVTSPKMS